MTGDTSIRGIRSKTAPSIDNTFATNDWTQSNNAAAYSSYNGTVSDLFMDPENGDFRIKDGTFNSNLGDPRWKE